MAERNLNTVITLGGKGSSLSSSSVFAVANGLAQVRIDSSALDRLNSFSTPQLPSIKYQIFIPKHLTLEEARASLVVLLNKLILSGSGVRTKIPILISEKLNLCTQTLDFEEIDITERELLVLENSSFTLHGICALLDYQTSALSAVADVVAALSCEALGANIWALKVVDSGDGFTIKDQIGVASDLDDLLLGSKLVGKVECDSVSQIPKINGALREVAKSVHSKTRVELNSAVGKDGHVCGGTGEAVATSVLPLVLALLNLGKNSLCRAKMILDSISKDDLKLMFDKKCPSLESLRNRKILESIYVDYLMFLQEANGLLAEVREAVVWEAVTAFVAIDLIDKGGNVETSGGNEKVEKKSEKKNKKKAVLGKGTATIVQLIKDRLQDDGGDTGNCFSLLEKRVEGLYAIFDPKDPDFASLGNKVKEIVESNESRRIPKVPKGTRDFSKEQMAIREGVFSTVTEVYKRHGAMALDTPVFELRETLMGKYGEDSKLIFDLADQGGELYSLRYDLTVPFARYMGMNGLTSFKRYQIAKVYRRDNPSKGRYREFYQCDFDIAGFHERMGPDFEVIKILTELLDELAIGDYEVKLNHRMLLDGMLEICGVPPEKFRTISSSIDKLDKQSFEQIKKEMVEEKGLTVETADKIGNFVKLRGSPLELLSKLKQNGSEFLENSSSLVALDDLEILFKALEKSKCIDKVVFDMSLARGLDYYTGVIFEAVFKGATQVGSIAAGGRYDNLIGSFGTKQVPAVGVSLGIERVFTIMEQIQKEQKRTIRATETQVLVSIVGDKDKDLPKAADIVGDLWKAKLKAEFMVDKRVKKHIDRALDVKIPFMVIQGERELNAGVVKLKDMEAAKEEEVPRESLVEELQRRLGK